MLLEKNVRHPELCNLYAVNVEANLSPDQITVLIENSKLIEIITADSYLYIRQYLSKVNCFESLKYFVCVQDFLGYFGLNASRLVVLKLSIDSKPGTIISLKGLPLLNSLEIDFEISSFPIGEYPVIETIYNTNLIELRINGDVRSISFLYSLLKKSPNLKSLVLNVVKLPKEELKTLHELYPYLVVNINHQMSGLIGGAGAYSPTQWGVAAINATKKGSMKIPIPANSSPITSHHRQLESDVVYTSVGDKSQHISDFDTKHDPEKIFTLQAACTHVSKEKKNRFKYVRDGVYHLDPSGLLEQTNPEVFMQYILPLVLK